MSSTARSIPLLTVAGLVDETGFRVTQLVWPLLVLQLGGGGWAVGLAAGASGVPVMLAPWWARGLRQWVDRGSRIALLSTLEGVIMLAVPVLYLADALTVTALVLVGLVRGGCLALTVPARSALMADVGDARDDTSAGQALSWDEGQTRAALVVGPALGGVLWGWGALPAVLACAVSCLLAGGLSWAARATGATAERTRSTIRGALRGRPDVQATWTMRGATSLAWYGIALGLPLLSVAAGYGATLAAVALACYGAGGIAVALFVTPYLGRLPLRRTQAAGWLVYGAAVVAVGSLGPPAAVVAAACLGGAGTQLANMCGNTQLATAATGADRRSLLSGQRTMVTVLSTVGLMLGGPLIDVLGLRPAIVVAGVFTMSGVVVAQLLVRIRARAAAPPA